MTNLQSLSLEQLEEQFKELIKDNPAKVTIWEAYEFAKQAHGKQERINEDVPYIVHPLRCAIRMISDFNIHDENMLEGMLCHDVIEDTDVGYAEVENRFGKKTGAYVSALTRHRVVNETPEQKLASKLDIFRHYLESPFEIRFLKLMDVVDNMGDWVQGSNTDEISRKIPRWLFEAKELYIPLAIKTQPELVDYMKNIINQLQDKGFEAKSEYLVA